MLKTTLLATLSAAATSAQLLDIPGLLASLAPAPEGDSRFTTFTPPGHNDVRSPCPGLNALANHGFLHHDGRNMTLPHLLEGLAAGLNMGADFTVLIGGLGLLASPDPLGLAFDLSDLDQHNFPIEHDASLSRKDAYFGNDYSFNSGIWNQTKSFFQNGKTALLPAALALANRTADSKETNPQFVYGLREFVQRYGEMSIFIQAMGGDDLTGVTRLDWVNQLFTQEKLPYNLGWRPRAEPITIPSLGQMVFEIFSVSPDKLSEGGKITADSYKNVFEVAYGGFEILNNITSGLASATIIERLLTGESQMTHAMVITAVHLDIDDMPVRWRVENSWSEAASVGGYFVMSDKWMDEFCYRAVVDKSVLGKAVEDVMKQEPKVLPLWDPMGALV